MYICMYVWDLQACMYVCMSQAAKRVCMYVCMYVCMPQTYINAYIHTLSISNILLGVERVCMYACMRPPSVYVCMSQTAKRVCMYALNIHTYTKPNIHTWNQTYIHSKAQTYIHDTKHTDTVSWHRWKISEHSGAQKMTTLSRKRRVCFCKRPCRPSLRRLGQLRGLKEAQKWRMYHRKRDL